MKNTVVMKCDDACEMVQWVYYDSDGTLHHLGEGNVWDTDVKAEEVIPRLAKLLRLSFKIKSYKY